MAWQVRLATAEDYEAVRDMSRLNWQESSPEKEWSDDRMKTTFFEDYLKNSECFIFVVEKDGDVCGFLLTGLYSFRAFSGLFTVQEVIFIRPDKRGTRAAALLMKKLVDWSKDVGALEILGGNDNAVGSEKTARFLARFGFQHYGYAMKLGL